MCLKYLLTIAQLYSTYSMLFSNCVIRFLTCFIPIIIKEIIHTLHDFVLLSVRSIHWACEKVASDLGLGGGLRRVLRFPPLHTTG